MVNVSVTELSRVEIPHVEQSGYFVDGDGTFFVPNTAELYPDAEQYLSSIEQRAFLALVSGNSDELLGKRRAKAIGADTWVVPGTDKWRKTSLYKEAAEVARKYDLQQGVVIDDRWLMGVASGRLAVTSALDIKTVGVLVRRRGDGHETWVDRSLLRSIETAGYATAVALGADSIIRPRN